jgi:hypothetical protein
MLNLQGYDEIEVGYWENIPRGAMIQLNTLEVSGHATSKDE